MPGLRTAFPCSIRAYPGGIALAAGRLFSDSRGRYFRAILSHPPEAMKARILFLAAALTLAALPVRAQTELQELVAAGYKAEAKAWEAIGDTLKASRMWGQASSFLENASNMWEYVSVKRNYASYLRDKAYDAEYHKSRSWYAFDVERGYEGRDWAKKRREAREAWEEAKTAWKAVAEAWEAHPEWELQAAETWEAAQRARQERPVVRAYRVQARAWDAEADFDFVEYDGFNEDKKSSAAGARINASRAANSASFAREQASRANLHALRARENASDWRRTAGRETGGLKELANKAAQAWESAAQAWEAVGE